MIQLTLQEAAHALKTTTNAGQLTFQGLSIDSRTIKPGNLFVAIRGNHLDGHTFAAQAHKNGAAAAIVDTPVDAAFPQLVVKDTTQALGQLGAAWRNQFNLPIIAVTGSNGKTTLKNMIESILVAACHGEKEQVLATQGTLNNHWGLPLTLAQLTKNHRYAVIEMGMNHFGEIAYLTQLTQPNVAVITNAAASHLEGVGDIAGVARAKSEIFAGLQPKGHAILNRDDAFYSFWHNIAGRHAILTFGFHPAADIQAKIHDAAKAQHITLQTPQGSLAIHLPLLGKHNVLNALAATAATLPIGVSLEAVKKGLEAIQPAPGRLQVHHLPNQAKVIDDTYNANPFSLKAAIDILATFHGKKILVLGDMKELGAEAVALHADAGKAIQTAGIDLLFTYGELSAHTAHAFGKQANHFNDQTHLITALKPLLHEDTTVLVKGSRSMRMEKIVADLIK